MFGKKKRAPAPKGQGAAAAKQMGLFLDFNPEEMVGVDLDDPDLEAELAAITGVKTSTGDRSKEKAKTPLPMEDIARMAEECMRDYDDEEDDNLEDDEDLLAELQEVVGGEEEVEDAEAVTSTPPADTPESPQQDPGVSSSPPGSLQHTLEERAAMYKMAVKHAKAAGEASKARRYDRGLKTLESMLSSVKKGRNVDEADIPPPVACGAPGAPSKPPVPPRPSAPLVSPPEPTAPDQQGEPEAGGAETPSLSPEAEPSGEEEPISCAALASVSSQPIPEQEEQAGHAHSTMGGDTKAMLLERQKEYKMAALKAKKRGDVEQARLYLRTSKGFDAVMEALDRGQAVDLSGLPPSPAEGTSPVTPAPPAGSSAPSAAIDAAPAAPGPGPAPGPAQPRDVLEALEQRRARYLEASAQAKASGDERKARMHDRIAKQYQSAIRSHKAGRAVNFQELPVPPGFPPIPGQEGAGAVQAFAAALDAANKLAGAEEEEEEEGDDEGGGGGGGAGPDESGPPVPQKPKKPMLAVPPSAHKRTPSPSPSPSPSPDRAPQSAVPLSSTASQQLDFLEGRRKQYMRAALQAKQRNDLDQARLLLRTAKGFEPMIAAARGGKAVDISKVPSPPGDEDEDFILVHHSDVQISQRAEEVYAQLARILREQHEKCMTYSKQFTHLGNITETTKFERMAESCKKSVEMLKLCQARGMEPPKHHFEERTYNTVRIFPDLSSTDMVVVVVKGMNLPAPAGVQANDLDAYVKFDFPYPSSEQPQKHRTAVIKNTNSPEYNQSFTLNINRNHRGFRRVLQSKGLKLEVLHKGGFLRSDKPVGTAHLKLEKLETQSEVREILEVMDGRKATGGRVEVRVRLREPLSGQDLQTATERWLVLDQSQVLL